MKTAIHPKIYNDSKVTCACGNTFTTISTLPTIQVDICSACHPLFTGTQKFVDTEGRIDKFNKKAKQSEVKKQEKKVKAEKPVKVVVAEKPVKETSLKEILKQLKEEEEQQTNENKTDTTSETPTTSESNQ